jgi:1-(5-phosphoribosyl)-5-[(5-phosphoribosylamino)methylideneamino] imidazole-4-carboxamide isomerase/N-(5'phosphoribosyl)anthranilate isomerase
MSLTLLPAVDVAGGQAVRLVQGAAGTETGYGDPLAAALAWQAAGAEWIHLVDLDAAFGRGSNAALLAGVVARLDVAVELSGGIRDDESLAAALATGCARVNVGTAALERPDWVRAIIAEHGDRVAVGLDVRGTKLAARGWTREGGELSETLARLDADGCARFVVTDVTKDGTLTGPNLDLLRAVCAHRAARDRQRRRVQPGRPAGDCRAGTARGGGCDRRQGTVCGSVHPGAGTGGGGGPPAPLIGAPPARPSGAPAREQ